MFWFLGDESSFVLLKVFCPITITLTLTIPITIPVTRVVVNSKIGQERGREDLLRFEWQFNNDSNISSHSFHNFSLFTILFCFHSLFLLSIKRSFLHSSNRHYRFIQSFYRDIHSKPSQFLLLHWEIYQ